MDLTSGPQHPPLARRVDLDFDRPCRPDWMAGSYPYSCLLNAYSTVFPALETIMVHYVAQAAHSSDVDMDQAALRAFLQQEGAHAREHRRSIGCISAQGFAVDRLERRTARLVRCLDLLLRYALRPVLGDVFAVAIFAAAEHWTAALSAASLLPTERLAPVGRIDVHPPPADLSDMEVLFLWHVAEELEHKSVVADLFGALGGGEFRRLGAFLLATPAFLLLAAHGFSSMLWQSPAVLGDAEWARIGRWRGLARQVRADLRDIPRTYRRTIGSYLRRGFHPSSHDTDALVREAFDRLHALRAVRVS